MEYFVNAWERLIITFENFTGNIGNEHKLIEFSDSSGINCGEIGSPRSFYNWFFKLVFILAFILFYFSFIQSHSFFIQIKLELD